MKTKKLAKALLSVALVMAMLFSMCIVGFTGVSAAGLELDYEFAYKNAGYAEGRLSLSGTSGTYILYWSDDTSALKGYTGIAQITVASSKKYFEMPANTAIPADAAKVIAVESGKEATVANASAVFDIPADKQFNGGTKQYDFMALSDIHIDRDNFYVYADEHLANSLEVAAKRDVEFIATCGDNMNGNNGTDKYDDEWKVYLQAIAASNYNNPIYETNGNHETYYDDGATSDPYDFGLNLYKKATGLNVKTEKLPTAPYYEVTAANGDHHIFMAMELISKASSPAASNTFTDAQLNWLENLLNKYDGDGNRIFIYQHAPFKNYGAGDNKVTPYYSAALVDSYPNVKRFKNLLEAHKDVITFSGHTHIDFKYGYNFDNENGKTAYTVHIPSNASSTHPNSSGGLDYPQDINSSQGYLVDVYDDYVILNGTDLAFNLICPSYTYMVDYTGKPLEKNELEDIVYETVTVTVDVSNLTDAPSSVVCVAVDETNAANNQSIPMTKNADGTYSAKVVSEFSSVYFAINGATGVKTSAFPVANCKIILGYQTLNYTPANSVSFVRAHVWGGGGDGTTWPGVTMNKSGSSYTTKIPASDYTGVVFNWGDTNSDKSGDLVIADYITDRVDDVYINLDGDNPTEPTTQATEPTQKPTEAPTTAPTEPATVVTEPTEPTTQATEPTEPAVDELAPIVIVEYKDDCFYVDAYAADGSQDVEFKFAVSGHVVQDYSDKSKAMFGVGGDGMYILEVTAKYADGSEHKTTVMIEVKDGVAILPEMPERPTTPATSEPTEPATSTPDETVPTTVTEPTTAPIVEYMYGDADLDGKINIKDATTVQKYAAKLIELDETAFTQADVTGDTKVNVKDATAIQKYVAKLIAVFPVEDETEILAAVGANATLMAEVKDVLSKEYQYASYDAYMALKKAYMNNVSDAELNTAYSAYKTMKSNNSVAAYGGSITIGNINIGATGQGTPTLPGPSIGGSNNNNNNGGNNGGDVTTETVKIYFIKPANWANAYIYGFYGVEGESSEKDWPKAYPGDAMTYSETDADGNEVYTADVPADIDYIKFSDGTGTDNSVLRTNNVPNSNIYDGAGYRLGASAGTNKWDVDVFDYTSNSGGNNGGDVTTDTITIHFKPDSSWVGAYIYSFYGVPGGETTGRPSGDYPGTAMTTDSEGWYYVDVPADIDYIKFSDGSAANNRTDNIANSLLEDKMYIEITTKGTDGYWGYNIGSTITPPDDSDDNQGGDTGSIKVYAINSANWSALAAHAWNTGGSGTTWPGTVMTKTSDKVNGFDVYSVSFDKEYGNIIFNDNKESGASQTDTLTFQTGKYYDVKTGLSYDKLSDVPAPSSTAANVFLAGEFNSWSTTKNEFSFKAAGDTICYLEMDLVANTSYQFKVITFSDTNEIEWRGLKDVTTITSSTSDITCSRSVDGNATIQTNAAGKYIFAFDTVNYTLSITFPG